MGEDILTKAGEVSEADVLDGMETKATLLQIAGCEVPTRERLVKALRDAIGIRARVEQGLSLSDEFWRDHMKRERPKGPDAYGNNALAAMAIWLWKMCVRQEKLNEAGHRDMRDLLHAGRCAIGDCEIEFRALLESPRLSDFEKHCLRKALAKAQGAREGMEKIANRWVERKIPY